MRLNKNLDVSKNFRGFKWCFKEFFDDLMIFFILNNALTRFLVLSNTWMRYFCLYDTLTRARKNIFSLDSNTWVVYSLSIISTNHICPKADQARQWSVFHQNPGPSHHSWQIGRCRDSLQTRCYSQQIRLATSQWN